MAAVALSALTHQIAVVALGSWVSRFAAPVEPVCTCHCHLAESPVYAILQAQLDRCGPENLSRACPDLAPCAWWPVAAGVVLGFLVGALAVLLGFRRAAPAVVEKPLSDGRNDDVSPLALSDRALAQRRLRAELGK